MRSASVFLFSGVLGFLASGQLSGCAQDCGPSELVDGAYRMTESFRFDPAPPMETGELLFERASERVTVTYGPPESSRRIVLSIVDDESVPEQALTDFMRRADAAFQNELSVSDIVLHDGATWSGECGGGDPLRAEVTVGADGAQHWLVAARTCTTVKGLQYYIAFADYEVERTPEGLDLASSGWIEVGEFSCEFQHHLTRRDGKWESLGPPTLCDGDYPEDVPYAVPPADVVDDELRLRSN